MSLFPAYSTGEANTKDKDVETTELPSTSKGTTRNLSYELPTKIILSSSSESDTKYEADSASDCESVKSNSETCCASKRLLEFSSSVEFYVDKTPNKAHLEWQTLPHLTRPLYKYHLRRLLDPQRPQTWATKRKRHQASKLIMPPDAEPQLSETAKLNLMERIRELKVLVASEPEQLDNWLKLHQLLGQDVSKSNRLAVAEHQLHTLETALEHHPGNEQLLQHYVDTTSATYPDSQVSTKIEQLLQRTPYEYTLWQALIMSTQGTMARCNIPDVMKIYEQCMRRMHLGPKAQRQQTDELMLKLFHNCVLFLRQSANFEKMYALLRLALELNFSFVEFHCFEMRAELEKPLLEYEELVLKSGMPMTEIWTRVERLRQAYNFLPYPVELDSEPLFETEDPQRMVYSADVCHYIYPLKEQKNTMHLLLITIQLTKMPLVRSSCLAERLAARISQIGDSDAIEMLLTPLGDRFSYALPPKQPDDVYWSAVMELCRELCVSPSFMPHTIGFDVHQRCIEELLDICGLCFVLKPDHETKRRICIMLWLRFRRLCLRLLQLSKKRIDGFVKDTRITHRLMLQSEYNRNITRFYTEMAMFEYEAREDKQYAFKMLEKIIKDLQHTNAEHLYALLIYTEMLIGQESAEAALELLKSILPNIRQLLDEALVVKVEDTGDAMPLEDYFLPDRLIMLLRLHCLQLHLQHESVAARQLLEQLIEKPCFALGHSSHLTTYRREQLRELQLLMMQLSERSTKQMFGILDQALQEFPRNLLLLQRCSMLSSLPWYKLRIRLMHTRGGIVAFLHLVLAARCRFQQQWLNEPMDDDLVTFSQPHLSQLLRNRLLNLFETLLPTNPRRTAVEAEQYAILRRNSLYWRLYLRCLSTTATSLERSKSCLLMALDECPWDKALYMDGVTYVPPELGNLQDVMMEKQVRIYAIPEELNVLRGD